MIVFFTIIGIAILLALNYKPEMKINHKYGASFGKVSDHFNFFNHGFAIGHKAITKKLSYTNFFLAAPTGAGKGTLVIIPCAVSLARGRSSLLFHDVSGELWDRLSSYLIKKGYRVLRLDFSNSKISETFNPLLTCRTISDIQKLCQVIIINTTGESKSDPFWENSSIMLLSLFCRYLVFHREPQYRTLQNVQRLIEKFATDYKAIDLLFIRTKDESLLSTYKTTVAMGDKTLQSVISTARTALNLFNDPEVCKTTSTNSIDLSALRNSKAPVAIFVTNPLKDLRYFKPLSALFFQEVFNYVLSFVPAKNTKSRSIFFILDEFATFKFPDFAVTISNIRKYNAGILISLQDEMSLISKYGQSESNQIKTNCAVQCFLKGQPPHTSALLSQILGKYSYEDEKGIQRIRELMTSDEVRMSDAAIILINNQKPLKLKATPYYKNIWLQHLSNMKPYQAPVKSVTEPTLIQFDLYAASIP